MSPPRRNSGAGTEPGPIRPDFRLRVRAAIADYGPYVAAACLLIALVGVGLTYGAYVDPGTSTEQRVDAAWETTTAIDHRAEVTRENPAYDTGTVLDDRRTYLGSVTPELEGDARFALSGAGGAGDDLDSDLDVAIDVDLVYRATTRDDEVLWSVTDPLASDRTSVAPGESASATFDFAFAEVANRSADLHDSFGNAGSPEVLVRATIAHEGTVAGDPVAGETTRTLTVVPRGDTYVVEGGEADTDRTRTTTAVEVPADPGAGSALGGPLLTVVGFLGLVGVLQARREGVDRLTPAERAALERGALDDWITEGRFAGRPPGRPVQVASLEGLVDLAADADDRVVYDPAAGAYVVLDDAVWYVYAPTGLPQEWRGAATGADRSVEEWDWATDEPGSAAAAGEDEAAGSDGGE